jgi:carbonic anhydrase
MVRNAGGRVIDAMRSLTVLQTIGAPGTIVVIHHTGNKFNTSMEGNAI